MANKAIRGITVEIGGDTTKLDKALANNEKKSRSLQTELREVSKLLKFDPTNTELLAQKQEILKSAISETAQKLDTLKEAEAQVVAQFEKGEIGEDQLRAFRREIAQTEKSLDDMKNELSTTEKALKDVSKGNKNAKEATSDYGEAVKKAEKDLEEFKDKAKETFETLKDGAVVMGTALGGAMVATGGYALNLSTEFDKAFNILATKTGASAKEMDGLNEAMERVYANNFGESIEDVANSMATVKTMTGLTGDELQKATENALLMRDTFDMDVNESIRAVNSLMDQFGITSEEAYNLIAQGAQKGLNQNDDLLDTINEYSVQFKNAGYSAEDMFNMLANGVEAGTWSVDKLGDAVKEFNIRASDGTVSESIMQNRRAFGLTWKEAKNLSSEVANGNVDAYKQLSDMLRSVDDDTKRYQLGVSMFGTMWEDLGEETVLALLNTQGEISKTSDALNQINDLKYDDIGSAIQGLGRTLETEVVEPLGEELKPVVEEAIEYVKDNAPQIKEVLSQLVDSVGALITWITDNSDLVISTIVAIGTGLLVWNVASMIDGVVGAIKAFKLANEGASIAQALFNAVLNANPLVLIATLLAALVAGIVTFIMTNDEARAKFIEVWNKIKETAKIVLDAIVGFFKSSWESIKIAWGSTKAYFSDLWTSIKNTFSSVGTWFQTTFSNAWTAVKNVFSGWGEFFSGLWTQIKNKFSSIGSSIGSAISSAVKAGINGVLSVVESTINKGIGLINSAIRLANKLPGVNVGTISAISLPRLAKGGIVNSRTIAEIGENGREAIIPLEKNTGGLREISRMISEQMSTSADNVALLHKLDDIYDRLDRMQIVLDTGALVGETIDKIDKGLANRQMLSARGV